jgi:hypothetical protein
MDIFDGAGKPNIEHASTDVATPSMGGGANDPAQLAVKLAAEVGTHRFSNLKVASSYTEYRYRPVS